VDSLISGIEEWKRLYEINFTLAHTPLKPLNIEEVYNAAEARFILARKFLIAIERLKIKGVLTPEQADTQKKKVGIEYHKDIKLLINRAVNYYIEEIE
jgi:hypothetical protein